MNQVNLVVIEKVKSWLNEHDKSIQWMAEKIGVSKSLMGHMLTGERPFLPDRMISIAAVMGISIDELLNSSLAEEKSYTLFLRGKAESRVAKRHLSNMLFAIEDCLRVEKDLSVKE